MTTGRLGLGKGLSALIRETANDTPEDGVSLLAVASINPNPAQPRKLFTEEALKELAESISNQGILQPLLVRPVANSTPPAYEIIAGERRWRAAQLAGLREVPVVIKNFSDQETIVAALVENMQREDLSPIEEALGVQMLKDEFSLSQDELAKRLGKSRSAIANSLRLLNLPLTIRSDIANSALSSGHGRALLAITNEEAQLALRDMIVKEHLSVRESEGLAAIWKETGGFEKVESSENSQTESLNLTSKKHKKRPMSQAIFQIQSSLSESFNAKVKVLGTDEKGKIVFTYSSQEELNKLIAKLESKRDV